MSPGTRIRHNGTSGVWWISPVGAVALVVPVTLWLAWSLSDLEYRELYRTPKVLTGNGASLFAAGALALIMGALLPHLGQRRRAGARTFLQLTDRQWLALERASVATFALTVVGYAAWLLSGLAHGVSFGAIKSALTLQGYDPHLKSQFVTIPGVTTLTQLGMPFVVLAVLLLLHGRAGFKLRRMLVLVLMLAAVRSYLVSERLASLELIIPIAVLLAAHSAGSTNVRARALTKGAPLILLPLLVVGFGAFEYSRSWTFYSTRTTQSYPEFTLKRIAGYYVTAYNNSEISLEHQTFPDRLPYSTLAAVWEAPLVKQADLYATLSRSSPAPAPDAGNYVLDLSNDILVQQGNPEFNSPGGLGVPFVDYGLIGGFIFLFGTGLALGLAYRGFVDSHPLAVLLYPLLATGVFELPRYLYWNQGRATPAFIAVLVVALRLHQLRPREPSLARGMLSA
jgi:hypothetical protein